ncbi:hypothetical protein N7495_004807 [Penicillium taxi]|uniref:uncharacterized protein n=1 Tax=Penicillium taxi TaxID=168475 RepID=UPI0025453BB2|nr:uncharacterized protein N7495_004807 [Penicillium taxi]KAJ5900063.1 hypothetical protein N7495_004807 [Penicillium taxi]
MSLLWMAHHTPLNLFHLIYSVFTPGLSGKRYSHESRPALRTYHLAVVIQPIPYQIPYILKSSRVTEQVVKTSLCTSYRGSFNLDHSTKNDTLLIANYLRSRRQGRVKFVVESLVLTLAAFRTSSCQGGWSLNACQNRSVIILRLCC